MGMQKSFHSLIKIFFCAEYMDDKQVVGNFTEIVSWKLMALVNIVVDRIK